MRERAWTLLLTGEDCGIAGAPGRTFEKSPAHYERVTVIERDPALARIKELETENQRLRAALGQVHTACYSMTKTREIIRLALLDGTA